MVAELSGAEKQAGSDLRDQSRTVAGGGVGVFYTSFCFIYNNKTEADLTAAITALVDAYFHPLRRTVRRNLSRLPAAFLVLAVSVRFGYGGLHLTSVARALPQGKKFKSSYQWLSRFLKCRYFDPSSLAEGMLALVLGRNPPPGVLVRIDPTTIDGVEVVNAAVPLEGRAVSVA